MAISTFSSEPTNASAALFTAWGSALSAALTAVGITATTDTGQVNWGGTITVPGTNTYSYYEIRQFTDALQTGGGSNPVYLKIEYGTGGASTDPGIRITIGGGSNGSGTLTGNLSSPTVTYVLTPSTTSYPSFVSSDDSRLQIILWPNSTQCGIIVSVSRTVNDSAAYTNDGVNIVTFSPFGMSAQFVSLAGGAGVYPPSSTMKPCSSFPPSNAVTGGFDYGINAGFFPVFPFLGYPLNFDLAVITCLAVDYNAVATGDYVTFSINGTNHNYMYMGSGALANLTGLNGNTSIIGAFTRCE